MHIMYMLFSDMDTSDTSHTTQLAQQLSSACFIFEHVNVLCLIMSDWNMHFCHCDIYKYIIASTFMKKHNTLHHHYLFENLNNLLHKSCSSNPLLNHVTTANYTIMISPRRYVCVFSSQLVKRKSSFSTCPVISSHTWSVNSLVTLQI